MNKIIIGLVIIILGGAGGYLLIQSSKTEAPKTETPAEETKMEEASSTPATNDSSSATSTSPAPQPAATPSPSPTANPTPPPIAAELKTFNISGKSFAFTPSQIKVNKGDRVKIVFTSEGGFHDWRLDEFSAATQVISTGQTSIVEFVADKTGTFEYYCSVGSHRSMGMTGRLVVE